MCIGNRAEVSSHYVNGQLRALYENALHCAKIHLSAGTKPTVSAVEYGTCLAEFYGPVRHAHKLARADLPFFAAFDYPRIEFVCNHEVVLFLNIKEGHYNLDTGKSWVKKELNEKIATCTLAFRIPFSSHAIENFHCKAIGNQDHYTAIFHVLEVESAEFVSEHSSVPGLSDSTVEKLFYSKERKLSALTYYLTKFYLPVLKRAGHHVLYSLPDFDNLKATIADIDYSVISTRALATDMLYGVRVEDINAYLRGMWLQAAAFVDEHGHSVDTVSKSFLAELRLPPAEDVDDMHLHLFFGPLQVQALCKREVVLYLDIQDVYVYFGGFKSEATEKIKDWKIAFIVNVTYEQDGRSGKHIKLDIKSARYCEHLSFFGQFSSSEIITRIKTTVITRIMTTYISILETSSVIFHHDKFIHGAGSEDGSDTEESEEDVVDIDVGGCSCEDEGSCGHTGGIRWGVLQRHILTHTHTYTAEYDLITSLTQGSINGNFKALWDAAARRLSYAAGKKLTAELQLETCLSHFNFVHADHGEEVFFSASFNAPKIQLVCKEGSHSAILYLHITKGHLKTLGAGKSLQPGSKEYAFSHWRLAFEVDLKIVDSSEKTTSSVILKRLGLIKPTGFKQLVLSLSSAKLNLSLSTVSGLLEGSDYRAIRTRREALAYYIQTCYFPLLIRANHHVLYSIPQIIPGANLNARHALAALRFEIVPFTYTSGSRYLEGIFGRYRTIFERNSIVIVGVTQGHKLSQSPLPRGINWVCGAGKEAPNGMVYLSRKSFLEGILLEKLERINRETTIIPTFSGIKAGKWVLEFVAWDEHRLTKDLKCEWREVTKANNFDSLEFEWRNDEYWRYEHNDEWYNSGVYSVKCATYNTLSIPTSQAGRPVIQLKGAFKLSLKYEGSGNDWSSETSVHWSANIVFNTTSSGLQVQLHPARIVPEFRSTHVTHNALGHETQTQAYAQLKQKFPDFIDFGVLLGALKDELEGMWTGVQVQAHELCVAHPVFNRGGDLLLELIVRGTHVADSGAYGAGVQGLALNGKSSSLSLKSTAAPVDLNGNGNATSEHWFRQAVNKAGDAIGSLSPSISRMSSTSQTSVATTETVKEEKVVSMQRTASSVSEKHASAGGANANVGAKASVGGAKTNVGKGGAGKAGAAVGEWKGEIVE